METPTIIRVSLEPFCLACGGGLELQEEVRTPHIADIDGFLPVFVLPQPCPWCGKALKTWDVGWRERGKEE